MTLDKWWTAKQPEMRASQMWAAAQHVAHREQARINSVRLAYDTYDARPDGVVMVNTDDLEVGMGVNVARKVIDGFVAKIAKSRVRIQALAIDGDYTAATTAKARTGFIDGLWSKLGVHESGHTTALDAAIAGTGFIKTFERDGDVAHERVLPDEIMVDPDDGRYGKPRTMYQIRQVDKAVLHEMFPSRGAAIETGTRSVSESWGRAAQTSAVDMIDVVEAWHLGDKPRHMICTSGGWLIDEKWNDDEFPFAVLRFVPQLRGFWTESILSLIMPMHWQSRLVEDKINENIASHGFARTFVEKGSSVEVEHIDDAPGAIISYSGQPPVVAAPQTTSPEIYRRLADLQREAYQQIGLSEMSATSQKPAGLTAAVAMRTYHDIESKRFALQLQEWERFHLDLARRDLKIAERIAQVNPDYSTTHLSKTANSTTVRRITFSALGRNENFHMRLYPTGSLPESYPGRMQTVFDLLDRGMIDMPTARSFIDMPDTDRLDDLTNVNTEIAEQDYEQMVTEGVQAHPQPLFDLAEVGSRMVRLYALGVETNVPDDRLQLVRQYMVELTQMMQPPPEQQPEQQAEEQIMPEGKPNP